MRVLHTSDWHIGRTFHGHPTLAEVELVLGEIPRIVRDHGVDVVVAAGDVFDSATPSGEAYQVLKRVLLGVVEAGASVVMLSGNHDSAARLGFAGPFAARSGVHIVTDPDTVGTPITIDDEYGPVDFYAVPFLEPALVRHRWPEETLRHQADVMAYAMRRVRESAASRRSVGARSVVVAHTFASGGEAESADSERSITVGTLDRVPVATFDGVDYVALGHVHGRMTLRADVRYSGAVLHYSFSEAGKPRGGWLVDLAADGLGEVTWVDLPVPRHLSVLTGELDALLSDPDHAYAENHWVSAVLTDQVRAMDAMRRLQTRFPHCASIEFRPPMTVTDGLASYAERVQGKSDEEIFDSFLVHVRNGLGPTKDERALIRQALQEASVDAAGS